MSILLFWGVKVFLKISLGNMNPDFNMVTRNTFKTLHKHDTKTGKNASQRVQIQISLNLITFLYIQSSYCRLCDL